MPNALEGVRVAITENRYPEQLTQLLTRLGATVLAYPLLKESPIEDASGARRFISICRHTQPDYIVFYTGVGVDFLFRLVDDLEIFGKSRILARGPKAVNALKRAGMKVDLVAAAPTTEGIVETLSQENLNGKTILVQLYGRENPELLTALQKRGATVIGISIYTYTEASDSGVVNDLIRKILDKQIDAITFTSATQVPFFFRAAEASTDIAAFRNQLKKNIVVASVGEVTSRALRNEGVEPDVQPEESKMWPMVKALGDFFESRRG